MNILIVAPRVITTRKDYYFYPIGLGYISAVLKAKDHRVTCIDLNYDDHPDELLTETIIRIKPEVICTGGLSLSFRPIREIVTTVRAIDKGIKVIIGGGIITSAPALMFHALQPDFIVIGEGEETIVELMSALEQRNYDYSTIKGIGYHNGDSFELTGPRPLIEDIETIPFPDYEGLQIERYIARQRTDEFFYYKLDNPRALDVLASRSCAMKCTFCFNPAGSKYRQRSLPNFFREVEMLIDRYHINLLFVADEMLSANKNRLFEFCEGIKKYKLLWKCQLRVDAVDEDILRLMKASGCYYISYGLESADDKVLKSMRKKITIRQIEKALETTRKLGIGIQGNFIFGDPAETRKTVQNTFEWWKKHYFYMINLQYLRPFPGCEDYRFCIEKGLIKDPIKYIEDGCPPVNMTSMGDETFRSIGAWCLEYTAQNRIYGDPIRYMKGRYDELKDVWLHSFTIGCPHCGERNEYRDFFKESEDYFKICCRQCNQKFDTLLEILREHEVLKNVRARLLTLATEKMPVTITPCFTESKFFEIMEYAGMNISDLNVKCILDSDAEKTGGRFLGTIPILERTKAVVTKKCAGHSFLVFPAVRVNEIVRHLLGECGVGEDAMTVIPNNPTWLKGREAVPLVSAAITGQ